MEEVYWGREWVEEGGKESSMENLYVRLLAYTFHLPSAALYFLLKGNLPLSTFLSHPLNQSLSSENQHQYSHTRTYTHSDNDNARLPRKSSKSAISFLGLCNVDVFSRTLHSSWGSSIPQRKRGEEEGTEALRVRLRAGSSFER